MVTTWKSSRPWESSGRWPARSWLSTCGTTGGMFGWEDEATGWQPTAYFRRSQRRDAKTPNTEAGDLHQHPRLHTRRHADEYLARWRRTRWHKRAEDSGPASRVCQWFFEYGVLGTNIFGLEEPTTEHREDSRPEGWPTTSAAGIASSPLRFLMKSVWCIIIFGWQWQRLRVFSNSSPRYAPRHVS